MKRFLLLFLAVLIWRGSNGLAVWNQKPAQYWQGGSLSLFGDQLPRPGVSTNNVQTAASTSGSTQAPNGSTGQSADSPNRLNPSFCGSVSLKPQISTNLLAQSRTGQLNSPVSPSQSVGQSVSLQQGSGSSVSVPYTAQSSGFQGLAGSPQTTSTSGFQRFQTSEGVLSGSASTSLQDSVDQSASGSNWLVSLGQGVPSSQGQNALVSQTQTMRRVPQKVQVSASMVSPQAVAGVSPSLAQQQHYDQSASGSSWLVSLGPGDPLVPQTQTIRPLPLVQGSGPQTSPQVVASVSAIPAQQQHNSQSASGWFVSSGQGIQSSQGQNAPVAQMGYIHPIEQGSVSRASPQGVASVSASPAPQWSFDQSWVASQVQSPGQFSTAVQTQLPGLAPGNVANLFTTAQGTYDLQSSGTSSWNTQPQRQSSVSTQFQPSQNAVQVLQGVPSSGSSKWVSVLPSGFNPSWSSVSPSHWVPATNNPYASLSQATAASSDAMFQSAGLGSTFQPSAVSTSNSATGSSSLSWTSRPSSVVSGRPLPSQDTWKSIGPFQSVLQGSAPVVLPAAPSNPPSGVPFSSPGATSSFRFVPSQSSDASAQASVVRFPINRLNFNTPGTSSSSSVTLPSFNSAVKG